MKTRDMLKIGDNLFSVDPLMLRITKFIVTEIDSLVGNAVLSSEIIGNWKNKQVQIQITISEFPVECNRLLYFKTEDDATKFVKTQIGM